MKLATLNEVRCVFCHELFPQRMGKDGKTQATVCESCVFKLHMPPHPYLIDFPGGYENVSLEKVEIDSGNRKAVEALREWVAGGVNVFLWGPTGTGKTYLASAAMNSRKSNERCYFTDVGDLLLRFQASTDNHSEFKIRQEIARQDVTLFDDLGNHRVTDFALEMFVKLLNEIASNRTPFIFTGNHPLEQIAIEAGERITSRLTGMVRSVELTGLDRRFV